MKDLNISEISNISGGFDHSNIANITIDAVDQLFKDGLFIGLGAGGAVGGAVGLGLGVFATLACVFGIYTCWKASCCKPC